MHGKSAPGSYSKVVSRPVEFNAIDRVSGQKRRVAHLQAYSRGEAVDGVLHFSVLACTAESAHIDYGYWDPDHVLSAVGLARMMRIGVLVDQAHHL